MSEQRRPEDGPMCFGSDWPGVFIRGDGAAHYEMALRHFLARVKRGEDVSNNVMEIAALDGLLDTLAGCRVTAAGDPPDTQRLKPWAECVAKGDGR